MSVSNEIGMGTEHPCEGVQVKANSKVRLAHLAWTEMPDEAYVAAPIATDGQLGA